MATKKSGFDGCVDGSVYGVISHVEDINYKAAAIPPVATMSAAHFCQRPFVLLKSCISSGLTCDEWWRGVTFRYSGKYQVMRTRLCTCPGLPFRFGRLSFSSRALCKPSALSWLSSIVNITEDPKHIRYMNNTHYLGYWRLLAGGVTLYCENVFNSKFWIK